MATRLKSVGEEADKVASCCRAKAVSRRRSGFVFYELTAKAVPTALECTRARAEEKGISKQLEREESVQRQLTSLNPTNAILGQESPQHHPSVHIEQSKEHLR